MIVEFIFVGTELLLGNIVNTNAAYLSKECAKLGLSCFYQTVVGDNEARLIHTIRTAMERSDIIILSGGLGPTEDDMTKECVAKAAGRKLIKDEHSALRIKSYFEQKGLEITKNNWKQAEVIEGSIVVDNHNGTAPGLILEAEGNYFLLLPGPPLELEPMFQNDMIPFLKKLHPGVISSVTVKLCGIGESKAETEILDLIRHQTNPTIAPYAKTGEVHLRVTAKADSEEEADTLIQPVVRELQHRFGEKIYSLREEETLEQAVVSLLREKNMTLGTAESCTGGMLSGRITSVSGASEVFTTGLITYANEAKEGLLSVKKGTLERYGAVSAETAEEMVRGVVERYKTDAAVSITGIAGPGGGSEKKPVGLVYIGCMVCGRLKVKEYRFHGSREKIRQSAATAALILLRKCITA